jgi:hypothetical protein
MNPADKPRPRKRAEGARTREFLRLSAVPLRRVAELHQSIGSVAIGEYLER